MYDPKFSVKQMYDQYGSSRKTTPSKPSNANQQAAASMGSVGIGGIGGRTTTSAAQSIQDKFRRETQRDSGSTYDEVPQTIKTGLGGTRRVPKKPDEEKSTYEKVKETVVGLFGFFGGDEPKDVKTKSGNVYTGPMFAGYTPDTSNFRDLYTEKIPLPKIFEDAGMRLTRSLNDVSPVLPSIDNPALNMFGVTRDFARDPDPLVPQATMEQPATTIGSPANYAKIKSGVDDILLNLAEDYTIEAGDTLSDIAEDRGTTVEVLQQLNDIPDSEKDTIFTGDKLKVPPKLTATQAALRRGLGSKKDYGEGVEVAALGPGVMGSGLMSKLFGKPDIEGNVDFSFIGELEGAKIKKGYIPKRNGEILGQSGVTVGTGVDLGSKNEAYFQGLSEDIKTKIRPHFGKKKAAAEKSLIDNPLTLTNTQVKELDDFVKKKELKTLSDRWNKDSDVKFEDLPVNKATAVAATFYQHGTQMFGYNYWKQATGGDWEAARDNLRNFGDKDPIFQKRRDKEADYLESGEL